jgi:hypothetical protein
MFDNSGLGCVICCYLIPMPILLIIVAEILKRKSDKRRRP